MANPQGTPVWYELMTPDPDGAKRFYDAVAGWNIEPPPPESPVDYRMISGPAGMVGGMMRIDGDMAANGATPRWLPYFGVDDVDATAGKAGELGAHIIVPPSDIPNVGRFAFMTDPQGAAFYIMRGNSPEDSTVFQRGVVGRCGWNELWTNDVSAAMAFYGPLLGFENRETMDMGEMGGYHFIDLGDVRIGAAAVMGDRAPQWNAYFTIPDVDAAVEKIIAAGGQVWMGPHTVPTGERIILGGDPQGAGFAFVSPVRA